MQLFGRTFVAAIVLAGTLGAGVALARPDDRAAAEATLKDVEASPRHEVAQEMVARSRAALERGARLRAAGDQPHARIADAVARTWADAAHDVLRTAEAEARAAALQRDAADASAVADRERALLEEGVAQAGRLRAQLEAATAGAKEPARTSTSAATSKASDKPGAKPKTKTRDGGASR